MCICISEGAFDTGKYKKERHEEEKPATKKLGSVSQDNKGKHRICGIGE